MRDKRKLQFITWMRHPVDRIVSHYFFWKNNYSPDCPLLHKRVIDENWTLEEFCLSEELQNIYTLFLWGFPLEYLDTPLINVKLNSNVNPHNHNLISPEFRKKNRIIPPQGYGVLRTG